VKITLEQHEHYITALKAELTNTLPGKDAQMAMAPGGRRLTPPPNTGTPRRSAVLIPMTSIKGRLSLLFTVRRDDLEHHGGEVSFPGGAVEESDSSCADTALREAQEEIQLIPKCVEVLGELTPLYVPPTHYLVHPVVGWIPHLPPLTANHQEVARILTVPFDYLLDPHMILQERWRRDGLTMTVPFYQVEDWPLWGATAMMLNELLVLTRRILKDPITYEP